MAYNPTIWKDRAVEKPRTYTIQNNPDGTVTLIPAPGAIVEPGTPVNAANMNKLEQGLKTHEADFTQHLEANNPHGITKTIVGLNSVQNYGIATQSEAEVGTSNVKYMTPLRVKESINALAISKSVEGAYTGDGTNGRVINIGFRPKLVFIREGTSSTSNPFAIYSSIGIIYVPASVTVCRPFDSNYNFISDVGFGVSKSSAGFNVSGNSYTYYAIG